jgi:hypothetical protein
MDDPATSIHPVALVAGVLVVGVVLLESFETMVSPRRASRRFRLTRTFYRSIWIPWCRIGKLLPPGRNRESLLSVFGPLSLLLLLTFWVILLVLGFTLLHWGTGSGVRSVTAHRGWWTDLYASGATLFTLTPGDISPVTVTARLLTVIEAGLGLGMLAMVIGYLPILAQAFSRREVHVSLLDARAGSPPSAEELLLRNAVDPQGAMLTRLLEQWEQWCAELLETHVSFPVLMYYRSQHVNQSWAAVLTTILDVCALLLAGQDDGLAPAARLTFAMARHAAVDLVLVFRLHPEPVKHDRLPAGDLTLLRQALRASGMTLREGPDIDAKLQTLRAMYEPYMNALGSYLLMPMPDWRGHERARDNWRSLE